MKHLQHKQDGLTILLFLSAMALSGVAAFYAVSGLVAIFAAAVMPIIVMGSMLEVSKLVVASWLYRNWKQTSVLLRAYFCIALAVLMLLTSMGIFGYLSKAHLDQAVPTGDVASKVAIIDEKIKTEKENVEAARLALKQMDAQVDQTLTRTEDARGAERAVQVRRGQQKERTVLLAEIGSAQTRIGRLNEERAPIASELRKVEAEVGPIKYIAALIYNDNPDQNVLEKAVRIVILMIVMVFDPMAVLMLIAVNQTINRKDTDDSIKHIPKEEAKYTFKGYTFQVDQPEQASESGTSEEVDTSTSGSEAIAQEPTSPAPDSESGSESPASEPATSEEADGSGLVEHAGNLPEPEPTAKSMELVDNAFRKINSGSDIKEVVERSSSGRPDRYK